MRTSPRGVQTRTAAHAPSRVAAPSSRGGAWGRPSNPGRSAIIVVASASPNAAPAANAVLLEQQRRDLETEARRAAYEAQLAAERSGSAWWEVDCPANMVNVQSLAELKAAVEGADAGRLVVVNFFAPECYACKSLQPKLRQIARGNGEVLFLKVNGLVGDLMGYCEAMGITKIPYFHFYRANKRVSEFSANMRPEKLALLRKEIAAHKAEAAAAPAAL